MNIDKRDTIYKTSSFSVQNSSDFISVMTENIQDYKNDPLNIRKALNAVICAYHIKEWVAENGEKYQINEKYKPYHIMLENLTNGTKHCIKKDTKTGQHHGAFSKEFDISYLYVIDKNDGEVRLEDILDKALLYWTNAIT